MNNFGPGTIFLDQLSQAEIESIWLGALLTTYFSANNFATEAQRLLECLKVYRLRASSVSIDTQNAKSNTVLLPNDKDALRQALLNENKLKIMYKDSQGRATERVVWPLDLENFGPKGAMLCWCEKRQDFRHFRFDRIQGFYVLPERTGAPRSVMANFAEIIANDDWD